MMLVDLEPHFVRENADCWVPVEGLASAQGLLFLCPGCLDHYILCWFADRGVSDSACPAPRWRVSGESAADLSLSPSINLDVPGAEGCKWHGWIVGGGVR